MTAPPAWPELDETALRDAADAWEADNNAVGEQLWAFQRGRAMLFNGAGAWSGDAANAAQRDHDKRIADLESAQQGARAAATLHNDTANLVVSTKNHVIENVEETQELIAKVENDKQATSEQKRAAIETLVRMTHAQNVELVADDASKLGTPPTSPAEEHNGIRAVDFTQGNPPPVDPLEEILKNYQVSEDPDGALEWEPSWPLSLGTDPKPVTAGEARMLEELAPAELWDLNQTKEAAEVEANVRFPPQNGPNDTADNHTDAFRHAYWNALMTQRFGENWTRDFATAHERLPNNPAPAEAMDLYNNEIGRHIATANPDATPAQLADMVEQAVNEGDTVVIAPGGEKLTWSDTVPWGDAGTTTPSWVPGQPPTPTGAGPGGVYDPGEPGGYGTSAGGY